MKSDIDPKTTSLIERPIFFTRIHAYTHIVNCRVIVNRETASFIFPSRIEQECTILLHCSVGIRQCNQTRERKSYKNKISEGIFIINSRGCGMPQKPKTINFKIG